MSLPPKALPISIPFTNIKKKTTLYTYMPHMIQKRKNVNKPRVVQEDPSILQNLPAASYS
jgi:hypothetical protein